MPEEPLQLAEGRCHLHQIDSKQSLHHLSIHSSLAHSAAAANQYFAKHRTRLFRILQLPGQPIYALLTDGDIVVLAADYPTLAPALLKGVTIFSGTVIMMRAIARGSKASIDLFEPEPPEA